MLVMAIRDHRLRGRMVAAGEIVDVSSGEFDRSGGLYRRGALTPDELAMVKGKDEPGRVMVAPPGLEAGDSGVPGDTPQTESPADPVTEKRRRGRPPLYGRRDMRPES